MQRLVAEISARKAKLDDKRLIYGKAAPMVSWESGGMRCVGVGAGFFYAPNWRTPIDFLAFYIQEALGREWGMAEQAKPLEERHPILQFAEGTGKFHNAQTRSSDGLAEGYPTGIALAYYTLAFDLWMVANNGLLDDKILARLKLADSYQGARYELWLRALFLKVGYKIELEDESSGHTTHVEFNVKHPTSKRWFSVEAKSTARAGHLGKTEGSAEMVVRINSNLRGALRKEAKHERIVFIDLNLPPHEGSAIGSAWAEQASEQLKHRQRAMIENENDAKAYVLLTNNPFHYVGESVWTGRTMVIASAMNIDGFLVGAPTSPDDLGAGEWTEKFRVSHPELTELMLSLETQYALPDEF